MRSFWHKIFFCFSLLSTVASSSSKLVKRDSNIDVFGLTKYGFRCGAITYRKYELYATALKGCKAWINGRKTNTCGATLCHTATSARRDTSFSEANFRYSFEFFNGPYMLYPILRTLQLYVDGSNMPPGPDRLVINRNCEVISVITNEGPANGPPSIRACQSQVSSLTPPSSPARSPASTPLQAPALSPARRPLNRFPTLSDGVGE